jgi:hypothetical protein
VSLKIPIHFIYNAKDYNKSEQQCLPRLNSRVGATILFRVLGTLALVSLHCKEYDEVSVKPKQFIQLHLHQFERP